MQISEESRALRPFVETMARRVIAEKIRAGILPRHATRIEIMKGISGYVAEAMRDLAAEGEWKGHQTLNDISIEKI